MEFWQRNKNLSADVQQQKSSLKISAFAQF